MAVISVVLSHFYRLYIFEAVNIMLSGWCNWKRLGLSIVSLTCVKLTKTRQQAFNPKIAKSFGLRPKPGGPMYHNNIGDTFKIHLCPSDIGKC